jgi:hypothetical protein
MRLLADEEVLQIAALAASREAEDMVFDQYRAGAVNYLNVVVAQTTSLAAARTVVQIRGERFASAVNLIAALGGGWSAGERCPASVNPSSRQGSPCIQARETTRSRQDGNTPDIAWH